MATIQTLQVTRFSMSPFPGFEDSSCLAPELIHRAASRRTCHQESYLESGTPTSVLRHVQSFSEASTWQMFPEATGAPGGVFSGDAGDAQQSPQPSPSILSHTRLTGSDGVLLVPSSQVHELGHSKAEALEAKPLPAWTHYSLRCRETHCSTRSLEEARASSRQGLPSKGWHRLSNDAEFYSTGPLQAPFHGPLQAPFHGPHGHGRGVLPFEEKPKGTGREFRFFSPQTSPLHEGLLQIGCGGSSAAPAFSLSDAPARGGHEHQAQKLSEGERTIARLLWSQLVPGGGAAQHRQEAESAEGAGYMGTSHGFAACSDPSELRDSDSDSYSSSSRSSEDDCLGEGQPLLLETDLVRPAFPRVKSILLVKSAAVVEELQQKGQRCKRVRWRDSHGDTLVNIREFDSDGLSSCWTPESSLEDDDEGLCAGCCTVS